MQISMRRLLHSHAMKNAFLYVTAIMLVITAGAKVWSLIGDSGLLYEVDPISDLTFGNLLSLAAALELGVAAVCLFRPAADGLLAVGWLSTIFITYRICLWWINWEKPCSCLGNLTDALHISPQLADDVMKGLLGFMLIGSVSLLILNRRRDQVVPARTASTEPSSSNP